MRLKLVSRPLYNYTFCGRWCVNASVPPETHVFPPDVQCDAIYLFSCHEDLSPLHVKRDALRMGRSSTVRQLYWITSALLHAACSCVSYPRSNGKTCFKAKSCILVQ